MKWRILTVLSFAEFFGMTLWFSATAVIPAISVEWNLGNSGAAWLTMSVQIGFAFGTFFTALFNLPDLIEGRKLFAISSLIGAAATAAIALWIDSLYPAIALRFITGFCLAGVYPVGMKILASWFTVKRGLAIGFLLGAVTFGSASPHLYRLAALDNWRNLLLISAAAAVIGAVISWLWAKDGPHIPNTAKFDIRYIKKIFANRKLRLAYFGYFGHMWELYAMWIWISLFLSDSFAVSNVENPVYWASLGVFGVISAGGIGCYVAGYFADDFGKENITSLAMLVSGLCCLFTGFLFGANPYILMTVCLIWGFAIVADSAQFSACVTELADPAYTGTALTFQTCLGFLLTMVSIRIIPPLVDMLTWKYAFAILAIGPVFGITSMMQLKRIR